MKTYTFKELEAMQISKAKLAELIGLSDVTFDYALPQQWVDNQVKKVSNSSIPDALIYSTLVSTTFWVYPKGIGFGVPISGCTEIAESIRDHGATLTKEG